MARALVTGTTGFVGGHLVEVLRNRGDEVVCLTRESSRTDLLDRQDVRQWWVWPSPPTPGLKVKSHTHCMLAQQLCKNREGDVGEAGPSGHDLLAGYGLRMDG